MKNRFFACWFFLFLISPLPLVHVNQLPPPREQVAVAQIGGDDSYPPEPWTTSYEDLTVRQAINRLVHHMGERGSWAFTGSADFRAFAFNRQGFLKYRTYLGIIRRDGSDLREYPELDEPYDLCWSPDRSILALTVKNLKQWNDAARGLRITALDEERVRIVAIGQESRLLSARTSS